MNYTFKKIYVYKVVFYLLLITYVVGSEIDVIPSHFIDDVEVNYLLEILSVAALLTGVFFSYNLFSMKRPLSAFKAAQTEEEKQETYVSWALIRFFLLFSCIFICCLVYYLSAETNAAHYAFLILLLMQLFTLPSKKEFHRIFTL